MKNNAQLVQYALENKLIPASLDSNARVEDDPPPPARP